MRRDFPAGHKPKCANCGYLKPKSPMKYCENCGEKMESIQDIKVKKLTKQDLEIALATAHKKQIDELFKAYKVGKIPPMYKLPFSD